MFKKPILNTHLQRETLMFGFKALYVSAVVLLSIAVYTLALPGIPLLYYVFAFFMVVAGCISAVVAFMIRADSSPAFIAKRLNRSKK